MCIGTYGPTNAADIIFKVFYSVKLQGLDMLAVKTLLRAMPCLLV